MDEEAEVGPAFCGKHIFSQYYLVRKLRGVFSIVLGAFFVSDFASLFASLLVVLLHFEFDCGAAAQFPPCKKTFNVPREFVNQYYLL